MPVEMIERAVLLADEAMQMNNDDGESHWRREFRRHHNLLPCLWTIWILYIHVSGDIAQFIKQGFDALYTPPWNCIVGRKFSTLITHEFGYFLYFFIGKSACVLFKAREFWMNFIWFSCKIIFCLFFELK